MRSVHCEWNGKYGGAEITSVQRKDSFEVKNKSLARSHRYFGGALMGGWGKKIGSFYIGIEGSLHSHNTKPTVHSPLSSSSAASVASTGSSFWSFPVSPSTGLSASSPLSTRPSPLSISSGSITPPISISPTTASLPSSASSSGASTPISMTPTTAGTPLTMSITPSSTVIGSPLVVGPAGVMPVSPAIIFGPIPPPIVPVAIAAPAPPPPVSAPAAPIGSSAVAAVPPPAGAPAALPIAAGNILPEEKIYHTESSYARGIIGGIACKFGVFLSPNHMLFVRVRGEYSQDKASFKVVESMSKKVMLEKSIWMHSFLLSPGIGYECDLKHARLTISIHYFAGKEIRLNHNDFYITNRTKGYTIGTGLLIPF